MKYAGDDAEDYDPDYHMGGAFLLLERDPIAILRALIRAVCVFNFGYPILLTSWEDLVLFSAPSAPVRDFAKPWAE